MNKNSSAEPHSSIDPEAIKKIAEDIAEKAGQFIKKHPLECIGGAVLVGVVVGLWVNRK